MLNFLGCGAADRGGVAEHDSGDGVVFVGQAAHALGGETFVWKWGFPLYSPVGRVKCIAAFLVFVQAELDVEAQGFRLLAPVVQEAKQTEPVELRKLHLEGFYLCAGSLVGQGRAGQGRAGQGKMIWFGELKANSWASRGKFGQQKAVAVGDFPNLAPTAWALKRGFDVFPVLEIHFEEKG